MAGSIFVRPKAAPISSSGAPYAGAKYYFYATGTSTLQSVYTDSALTTPHANPVVADGTGTFAPIWLDPTKTYRAKLTTAAGVLLEDVDPVDTKASSASLAFLQAGTGAVARYAQDKMREMVSVKDFGAKGDGTTDDTAAIQAALAYAYSVATGSGWRKDTPTVIFPKGNYRIAQANALFSGLSFYNGRIIGSGRLGGTTITYDVPAATSSNYLIYNNDSFGFVQFEAIKFASANVSANQNFMYYYSSGNAQNFSFTQCEFDGFSQLFNVQGAANASENTFFNCKFSGFSDCAFRLNNPQSVNWRFYSCDAEVFTGTLFEFLQGATVLWSQGSIIPTASTSRILKVPSSADSNYFGPGNSPQIKFDNSRFEMRSGSLMVEKLSSAVGFSIIFDSCGMGGLNVPSPTTYKMFTWVGAGRIELRQCDNLANYRFDHSVSGSFSHELFVTLTNCKVAKEIITGSTFTVTGGSSQNTGYSPTFYIKGCGSQLDGTYRAKDSQYMNNSLSSYIGTAKELRAVSFSPETGRMAVTSGATYNLYVPPCRVTAVEVFPVANSNGAIQGTVTVKNAAGTVTLGTATWTMGSPASVKIATDCNYFVDALSGDYLTVQFSHNYTPGVTLTFDGQLYLRY